MSEAIEQYGQGFKDGASGVGLDKPPGAYHPEYLLGHGDGTFAFCHAIDICRTRLKEPLFSEVMTTDVPTTDYNGPSWACNRWGGWEHDWLDCPECVASYEAELEQQHRDDA